MKIGKIAAIAGLVLAAGLLAVPTASFVYEAGAPGACARCHEMAQPVSQWASSTHRNVTCAECHGSALTTGAQFHMTNAHRVWEHSFGEVAERASLRTTDVFAILARCQKCHAREYASWSAGPHAVHYAPVFLDRKTNSERRLMDDCLRCHGMHYAGGIRDLVTPLDNRGPWTFRDSAMGARPAIPCLACHAIHQAGEPSKPHLDRAGVPRQEALMTPSLALWDRRTGVAMPAAMLPLPGMFDGGRAVKASPDPRQGLCYQCHAPLANLQVRSGDDRTPVGVHEGLSCLACHDKHRQTTRASCANCHPRLSNCGRDVETMDTTFFNKDSRHNVHFVKCADCHTHGIPPRKNREPA